MKHKMLSMGQVAKKYNVSRQKVYLDIKSGKLPAIIEKKQTVKILIEEKEAESFYKNRPTRISGGYSRKEETCG